MFFEWGRFCGASAWFGVGFLGFLGASRLGAVGVLVGPCWVTIIAALYDSLLAVAERMTNDRSMSFVPPFVQGG